MPRKEEGKKKKKSGTRLKNSRQVFKSHLSKSTRKWGREDAKTLQKEAERCNNVNMRLASRIASINISVVQRRVFSICQSSKNNLPRPLWGLYFVFYPSRMFPFENKGLRTFLPRGCLLDGSFYVCIWGFVCLRSEYTFNCNSDRFFQYFKVQFSFKLPTFKWNKAC